MTVLNKICAVLNVNYGDIVEYIPTEGEVQE
jgi:DNA-binding Xre family transcriptional regulator